MTFMSDHAIDPVLEMCVEDRQTHVDVRLVGILDRTTTASLLFLVGNLLTDGLELTLLAEPLAEESLVAAPPLSAQQGETH